MADLEDASVLAEEPDLSDVALVVVNVETRDGHQYTFMVGLEDARHRMGMTTRDEETSTDVREGSTGGVVRTLTTREWVFTVTRHG